MPPGGLPPTVRSLIGLTQQASVRRGPVPRRPLFSQQATVRRGRRASAPSLFTASHCSPRSPCLGALSFHSKPLFAEVAVPRCPLFSASHCSPRSPCLTASHCSPRSVPRCPLFSKPLFAEVGAGPLFSASHCSPRSCLGALSFQSHCSPRSPCLGALSFHRSPIPVSI